MSAVARPLALRKPRVTWIFIFNAKAQRTRSDAENFPQVRAGWLLRESLRSLRLCVKAVSA